MNVRDMQSTGSKKELPTYNFKNGEKFVVTDSMKRDFWDDGFIIVRNLLAEDEVKKLRDSLEAPDSAVMAQSYEQDDGDGRNTKLILWNHPGNDLTGVISRSEKLVDTCEALMGGEVYHYHSKMTMKEAFTGGAFQWHQDYGYWYLNGILYPNMISIQFAVDAMDMGNGCLQVLRGSHKLGRIDHGRVGSQAGADMERVEMAQKVLQLVPVELNVGDGLIFHCNLLHRSNQNSSARRRWSLITCYNMANNDPYKDHHHARYTPLKKVKDSAIMECTNLNDIAGKWFTNPNKDNPGYIPDTTNDGQKYGI